MSEKYSIALLPLDNRPVSYLLPKQIADFSGINLILPERKYLGDLNRASDLIYIDEWLQNLVKEKGQTQGLPLLVISLDNLVYGGLVQSRRHSFKSEELKSRVDFLNNCRKSLWPQIPAIYGFSSIMRISNYNSSEEEKDYWKDYGEKIFKWSELTYRVGRGILDGEKTNEELIEKWYQCSKSIPSGILADYKSHRDKNFTMNMLWLDSLHAGSFEYLIFSCDDSGKYGMNVVEAEYLRKQIKSHNFSHLAKVISGTE